MTDRQGSPEGIAAKLHDIAVLHEQGGFLTEAVQEVGITKPTYRRWRRQYGDMSQDEIRWVRQLMDESRWPSTSLH